MLERHRVKAQTWDSGGKACGERLLRAWGSEAEQRRPPAEGAARCFSRHEVSFRHLSGRRRRTNVEFIHLLLQKSLKQGSESHLSVHKSQITKF